MKLLEFLETIREDESTSGPGKFVGARLTRDSERAIMQWMRENGLRKKEPRARLHITVVGDKEQDFDWNPATFDPPLEIDPHTYSLEKFGDDAIVLSFSVPELEKRHQAACDKHGIDWKHDTYQPHLTLSFDPTGLNDMNRLLKPTFPMYVANEYAQPWEFKEGDSRYERRRKARIDEAFLMERNMMNAPWVKEVAQQYATDNFVSGFTDVPHIGEWAAKALAKYLINEYPAAIRINSFEPWTNQNAERPPMRHDVALSNGEVVGQANVSIPRMPMHGLTGGRDRDMRLSVPQWALGAIERGDELFFLDTRSIQGTGGLPEQTSHVRDWMRNRIRNQDPVVMNPGRLGRMTWAQALQASQEWHEQMKAGGDGGEEDPSHKELFLDLKENGQWWKLTGETCLTREGDVMGHCVADYVDEVESGNSVILSLRDKKNRPHVTVELAPYESGYTIEQIKGKENEPPVQKYWPQVETLLKHLLSTGDVEIGDGEGEHDTAALGIIIAERGMYRVKAHGEADKDPESWNIEVSTTVEDMGKEMDYDEETTVGEYLSNDPDVSRSDLLVRLARDGEWHTTYNGTEAVITPMYPWSFEEV